MKKSELRKLIRETIKEYIDWEPERAKWVKKDLSGREIDEADFDKLADLQYDKTREKGK